MLPDPLYVSLSDAQLVAAIATLMHIKDPSLGRAVAELNRRINRS